MIFLSGADVVSGSFSESNMASLDGKKVLKCPVGRWTSCFSLCSHWAKMATPMLSKNREIHRFDWTKEKFLSFDWPKY